MYDYYPCQATSVSSLKTHHVFWCFGVLVFLVYFGVLWIGDMCAKRQPVPMYFPPCGEKLEWRQRLESRRWGCRFCSAEAVGDCCSVHCAVQCAEACGGFRLRCGTVWQCGVNGWKVAAEACSVQCAVGQCLVTAVSICIIVGK